ncbi:MAG TPA: hypothetical protein VFA20_13105 [Myxococcaceae bacterium]|nr:hypothetical protein [Myxococcaceae bacterium]
MKDLPLTIAVFAALAAACWYAGRLRRPVPTVLRAEVRSLREKLDRLSARNVELSGLLQRSVERLQLLAQVDRELTDRALDLDALLSTLARRLAHAVGDAAAVYLPEQGRPAWRGLEGATASLRDRAVVLFEAAGLSALPEQLRDSMAMGRAQVRDACGLPGLLAVPLRSRAGQVVGAAVLVRRPGAPPYGEGAVALCEQVCERAVSALEVAREHQAQETFAAIATRELRAQSKRVLQARSREEIDEQTARLARLMNGDVDLRCSHGAPGPDPLDH